MRRGDANRRDRGKRRDKANRQTEGDLGGKGKTEDAEGSRLAEFAKGDLNGRDEGEEMEGFSRGGAEGTSDPAPVPRDNAKMSGTGTNTSALRLGRKVKFDPSTGRGAKG